MEEHDGELRLIAEQAQMLTQASGAAIALRQGELMVCRARAGETAPDLGSPLDIRSGLSGECVRSGQVLVCDDTENDPRVNLDVCRYLGTRSIAVLPIVVGQDVAGVLEAFSQRPGAFSASEVSALNSMCDLVVSVVRPQPAAGPWDAEVVSALAARVAAERNPKVPAQPLPAADPEDDLICEIEQRAPATRPLELVKGGRPANPTSPPGASLGFQNADPEDDLLCEIEKRWGAPAGEHALRAFTPAAEHPRERTVSRKLIAAGVGVVVAGLLWLAWCNHARGAQTSAASPTSVPQVAQAETQDGAVSDLQLLLDSAAAGDANAQLALAVRYANGDGVAQSYPEALKWFTAARAQGVTSLQGSAAEAWGRVQQWAKAQAAR